jgi:hypothetical protein
VFALKGTWSGYEVGRIFQIKRNIFQVEEDMQCTYFTYAHNNMQEYLRATKLAAKKVAAECSICEAQGQGESQKTLSLATAEAQAQAQRLTARANAEAKAEAMQIEAEADNIVKQQVCKNSLPICAFCSCC